MTDLRAPTVARRAADLLFLAGAQPGTVRLLGGAARSRAAVESMGWTVVDGPATDVCVCDAVSWRAAVAGRPRSLVITGRVSRRALGRRGYAVRRAVAWPDAADPVAVATLDPGPLRQLFGLDPASTGRRVAGGVAASAARMGLLPSSTAVTIAEMAGHGGPWPLRAADHRPVGWLMSRGHGDDLQRLVFLGFDDRAGAPRVAVKLGRVPGHTAAFDGEQRGLALLAAAGREVAGRAPALLGRATVAGLPASVESAAPGRRLCDVLGGRQSRSARLRLVDAVAAWTVDLCRETRGPLNAAATAELRSLAAGAGRSDLQIAHLAGALVHGDLGTWNIVTPGSGFTVVDWESARRPGLALSDLAYFLADALTLMSGRRAGAEDQTTAMLRLFRGDTDLSDTLFGWIRRAATATGVAAADVGPVLTLTWLWHARSPQRRQQALQDSPPATAAPHARLAARWLVDPKLGWRWDAWRT
jgi:hypothetical protein